MYAIARHNYNSHHAYIYVLQVSCINVCVQTSLFECMYDTLPCIVNMEHGKKEEKQPGEPM